MPLLEHLFTSKWQNQQPKPIQNRIETLDSTAIQLTVHMSSNLPPTSGIIPKQIYLTMSPELSQSLGSKKLDA